jgi:ABC-type polysaccharide/polyol phosphate export permease
MSYAETSTIPGALRELWRYKELLLMITYRDIRVRYKQSIMGLLWAVLMPAVIVMAGIVVRYGYSVVSGQPLQISDITSVAVRSLPWAFTVSAIRFGTNSLVANNNLVTKIYFPKEVFPLAAVAASLFDFAIAGAVLTVLLAFAGVGVSMQLLWVPVILLIMTAMVAGFGLLFAAAGLFFRDVKYLVEIILTFGIFFTPVFYSAKMFGKFAPYLLANPLAPLFEALDATVIQHRAPDPGWLGYSAGFAVFLLLFGYKFFKNLEPAFAESI